jgi:hypothetical protein
MHGIEPGARRGLSERVQREADLLKTAESDSAERTGHVAHVVREIEFQDLDLPEDPEIVRGRFSNSAPHLERGTVSSPP